MALGEGTGWKEGIIRNMPISELGLKDECDQAVMNFLVAIEVGKFQLK